MTNSTAARALKVFDRASNLMACNLATANAVFEGGVNYASALVKAQSVEELAAIQSWSVAASMEQAVAYCRGVYGMSESEDRMSRLIDEQFWSSKSPVGSALEKIVAAPEETTNPLDSLQPGLAATLAALDQLLKTVRKYGAMAREDLELAAESMLSGDVAPAAPSPAAPLPERKAA